MEQNKKFRKVIFYKSYFDEFLVAQSFKVQKKIMLCSGITILINRHQSKIYGFIYSKMADRDVADDIFQDTFIKVIKT